MMTALEISVSIETSQRSVLVTGRPTLAYQVMTLSGRTSGISSSLKRAIKWPGTWSLRFSLSWQSLDCSHWKPWAWISFRWRALAFFSWHVLFLFSIASITRQNSFSYRSRTSNMLRSLRRSRPTWEGFWASRFSTCLSFQSSIIRWSFSTVLSQSVWSIP